MLTGSNTLHHKNILYRQAGLHFLPVHRGHHEIPVIRGEAALAAMIVVNSMGVQLITYSGLGSSAIASVPYALSCLIPSVSQGTFTICFQLLCILTLMILKRKIVPKYFLSMLVGTAFSLCLDLHEGWVASLPNTPLSNALCYMTGYLLVCLGVALANNSKMPINPTDLFPRELAKITGISYSSVKTGFDVACLITTAVLTLVFLGNIQGLGVGTIVSALTMGKVIHLIGDELNKNVVFESVFSKGQ